MKESLEEIDDKVLNHLQPILNEIKIKFATFSMLTNENKLVMLSTIDLMKRHD